MHSVCAGELKGSVNLVHLKKMRTELRIVLDDIDNGYRMPAHQSDN